MSIEAEIHQWWLTRSEIAATREKLAKYNARAKRRGNDGVRLHVSDQTRWAVRGDGHRAHETQVSIVGTAPQYAGWTFVAAIRQLPGAARPVVYSYDDTLDHDAVAAGVCDHCGTKRARRTTYLLRKGDRSLHVGSTCLTDFLGAAFRPVLLDFDRLAREIYAAAPREYEPSAILALAYMASKSESDMSIRDQTTEMAQAGVEPADWAIAAADRIRGELKAAFAGETSGYPANLCAALTAATVTRAEIGLVASGIAAHGRISQRPAPEVPASTSEWIGQVGDAAILDLTITGLHRLESYYGYRLVVSRLVIAQTEGGDVIKMTTAAAWAADLSVGDRVTVSATVKAHATYRDARQTVLSRPKLQRGKCAK